MRSIQKFTFYSIFLSLFISPSFNSKAFSEPLTADYVIVGVGTAGAVLANKLSADKQTSVIAIHNGENITENPFSKFSQNCRYTVGAGLLGALGLITLPEPLQTEVAGLLASLPPISNPLYESGGTIPQPNADFRSLLWIMALPEGGASSVNAGVWCRGTNQLYAQWEAIAGPNWSVQRILDVYKELERYRGNTTNPQARGFNGPLTIHQSFATQLSKTFAKAIMRGVGVPFLLDYNDPNTPIGVSTQLQITQHGEHGRFRVSSVTAFLGKDVVKSNGRGAHGRKLRVLLNSTGLRTIWHGKTAIGVEYLHHGKIKQAFAKKGVIVCAGLRSSSFLMQSGVGPQALLTSLGIPVVFDNPSVGQGLADQPHVVTVYTTNPNDDSSKNKNSLFSELSWLPAPGGSPTSRQLRFTVGSFFPGIALGVMDLVQPLSRGSIVINSSDPLSQPVIDFGELSNPNDLNLFKAGFSIYLKAINAQLQEIDPLYQMIFPDPAILDDDALLTAFIQEEVGANMHFQSHCRMAPFTQGGVVDGRGRVYGVENLIVADNSINPIVMDGSPMASAYLVAANIAKILGY